MRDSSTPFIRPNRIAADGISPSVEARRVSANELAAVMLDARRMAHLAAIFSNPTRSKILMLLASHPRLNVSTLAILVGTSVSLVSHHLAMMKTEGWIAISNQGRMRHVRLASPQRLEAVRYIRDAGRVVRGMVGDVPADHLPQLDFSKRTKVGG